MYRRTASDPDKLPGILPGKAFQPPLCLIARRIENAQPALYTTQQLSQGAQITHLKASAGIVSLPGSRCLAYDGRQALLAIKLIEMVQ